MERQMEIRRRLAEIQAIRESLCDTLIETKNYFPSKEEDLYDIEEGCFKLEDADINEELLQASAGGCLKFQHMSAASQEHLQDGAGKFPDKDKCLG
ncbi:hypothetical protein Q3G72_012170 [Acer saccharum]|nr:hypothetical protein Q3G72_012170 [Acer saccharum]